MKRASAFSVGIQFNLVHIMSDKNKSISFIEYTIIKDDNCANVSEGVMLLLDAGWELHGGMQMSCCPMDGDDYRVIYAQALVHKEMEDDITK